MIKFLPRRAICAGLVVMGLSVTALAAQPLSTGLGQAWPNAQDVSASTQWHVYVFSNGGIQFVQVNDLAGNVRAAVGAVNGQFLVLPMGRDAARISTPQQPVSLSATVVPLTLLGPGTDLDTGVVIRSGRGFVKEKPHAFIHWMLDPETGKPYEPEVPAA